MPRRGTTDAIFIIRQFEEAYIRQKQSLLFAFVDLERALMEYLEKLYGGLSYV